MRRTLLLRSLLDSWQLLAGCCGMLIGFLVFRVWVVGQMDLSAIEMLFKTGLPEFIRNMLPVPFEVLATPEGRLAFAYEDSPTIVLTALWAVSRGTNCLAGRLEEGTMELLLAQPVRRFTIFSTHTTITLLGCVALGAASWLGTGLGIAIAGFEPPPAWRLFIPTSVKLVGLSVFWTGLATLISAFATSRGQAVGVAIGFYVFEITFLIVSRLSSQLEWMKWITVLSAYEPTATTIGIANDPAASWPLFWQANAVLYGGGVALLAAAALRFCRRDVPAPV